MTLRARETYAENFTNEQNSLVRGQIKELRQLVYQNRPVNALANPLNPVSLSAQGNPTATLSSETVKTSTLEHRSDKIPEPPMFDGSKTKLRELITKLQLKIIKNADLYPTTQETLVYVASRLEGDER